jgi:hypothetical protein
MIRCFYHKAETVNFFFTGVRTSCRQPFRCCGVTYCFHHQGIFFPFFTHLTIVYSDDACRFTWNVRDLLCVVSPPIKHLRGNYDSYMYSPFETWWHTATHGRESEEETAEWSGYPVLFTLPRNMVYPALLPLMRTPRLPVVDWTDAPAEISGPFRFAERQNLFSARVPSHFKRSLPVLSLPTSNFP